MKVYRLGNDYAHQLRIKKQSAEIENEVKRSEGPVENKTENNARDKIQGRRKRKTVETLRKETPYITIKTQNEETQKREGVQAIG